MHVTLLVPCHAELNEIDAGCRLVSGACIEDTSHKSALTADRFASRTGSHQAPLLEDLATRGITPFAATMAERVSGDGWLICNVIVKVCDACRSFGGPDERAQLDVARHERAQHRVDVSIPIIVEPAFRIQLPACVRNRISNLALLRCEDIETAIQEREGAVGGVVVTFC